MGMALKQCCLSIHSCEDDAYLGRRFELSIRGPNGILGNLFRAPFRVQGFDSGSAKSLFRFSYKDRLVGAHLVVLFLVPLPAGAEIIE